jgi:DNA-binding NarL/FixJ family response regulator
MARTRTTPIRVLIVDDHRTFGEALELAFSRESDLEVVEVVTDPARIADATARHRPDVVLLDLDLPGMDGARATRRIRAEHPGVRVIVLSGQDDPVALARALQAGASGCILRSHGVLDLAEAVRRASRGEPIHDEVVVEESLRHLRRRRSRDDELERRVERLTPRELQVLQEVAAGRGNDEIARTLGMSRNTVRTHLQNILTKLGVHSKLEALLVAIRYGKVRPPGRPGRTELVG